jgi:hypothetical protein
MFNKDAMADVVVELVESKKEEIMEQVEAKKEEIEKKVDEVADKAESAIENTANEIGKKAEAILDKLDDNPQIAKALDVLDDVIGDQLDGREISCSCFGWLVALRIARKSQQTPPSKSEETPSKVSPPPAPNTPATEQVQSTVPPSSPSGSEHSP